MSKSQRVPGIPLIFEAFAIKMRIFFFFFGGGADFFVKLCDNDFRRRMGMGRWKIGHEERTNMRCYNCNIAVDDLKNADHIFEDVPSKKTYIFWHDSASTTTYEVSTSFGSGSFIFQHFHVHTFTFTISLLHVPFHNFTFTRSFSHFHIFTFTLSLPHFQVEEVSVHQYQSRKGSLW